MLKLNYGDRALTLAKTDPSDAIRYAMNVLEPAGGSMPDAKTEALAALVLSLAVDVAAAQEQATWPAHEGTLKTVTRDDDGRISAVIEERVNLVTAPDN